MDVTVRLRLRAVPLTSLKMFVTFYLLKLLELLELLELLKLR